MTFSLIFGKVIGIYLIIVAISMLARQGSWMKIVKQVRKNESFPRLIALFELLVGLFIVVAHNMWVASWEVAITIVGWLMLIEGAAYLLLPHSVIEKKIQFFNKPGWYTIVGIVSLVVGLYLVGVTYGFFAGV